MGQTLTANLTVMRMDSGVTKFVQTHPEDSTTSDHDRPDEKKADPVLPRSAFISGLPQVDSSVTGVSTYLDPCFAPVAFSSAREPARML